MFDTLRHAIIWLTLSCLMASCASSGTDEPSACGAVRFDNEGISRATHTTSGNIYSSPFVVYGDMIRIAAQNGGSWLPVCEGTEVRYDQSAKEWIYDDTRYWFPDFQYSFVALHPADAACVLDPEYVDSRLGFRYLQPADYKDADDLLIAAHRRNFTGGTADAVRFRFDHILTNINVAVTYTNTDPLATPLKINGITFRNIPTEAAYSVAAAPLSASATMTSDYVHGDKTIDGWTIIDKSNVQVEFYDSDPVMIPHDNVSHLVFSDSNALLLLPNSASGTEMILSYTVYEDDGRISHELSDVAIIPSGWQPGRSYILSVVIVNDKLQVTFKVTDWMERDPIETIVPRI